MGKFGALKVLLREGAESGIVSPGMLAGIVIVIGLLLGIGGVRALLKGDDDPDYSTMGRVIGGIFVIFGAYLAYKGIKFFVTGGAA